MSKDNKWPFSIIFFILMSIFLFNVVGYYFHCFPATDFSIYQEAIYRLGFFKEINPYLLVRGLRIFSDHFDPIIYFAIPFVKIFDGHPVSLLVFQMSWIICSLVTIRGYFLKENNLNPKEVTLYFFYFSLMLLLSRGIIGGLVYPLHPITWSVFPLLLLVLGLKKRNDCTIVFCLVSLLFFKEIYPLCVLLLSLFLIWQKKQKIYLLPLALSILFIFFIFVARGKIWGPVFPYSQRILSALMLDPLFFMADLIRRFSYKDVFKIFVPYIIPFYLLYPSWKKSPYLKEAILPVMIFLLPFFAANSLSNVFFNWNALPFSSLFTAIIIFSPNIMALFSKKKISILIMMIFLLSSSKFYEKVIKLLYFRDSKTCEISLKRIGELDQLEKILTIIPKDAKIVATTGIIPWNMRPDRYFYHAGEYSKQRMDFDYMILERGHLGFITPYSAIDIENFIDWCTGDKVLLHNRSFFVAKGPFTKKCLTDLFVKWNLYPSNY